MTLPERIAARILSEPRLRGVPAPVVEEVLKLGLAWLANHVPMTTLAANLDGEIDFEACEVCGHLIDPEEPAGAVHENSEDGVWLCNACAVDGGPGPTP
jgi:hypothetical protein